MRNLERNLATVLRKIARKVASGDDDGDRRSTSYEVKNADIESYLGLPKFEHEFAERHPEIGVTTGLAWTSFGGEIMFIEATRMPGSGRTTVTGQLGDVMRESVQAAYSYVRSKAHELEIDDKQVQRATTSTSTSPRARSRKTARPPASPSPPASPR